MQSVTLRRARLSDLELLFAWRSNPRIYKHFHDQDGPLHWNEHIEWFTSRDPDRRDLLIEYGGRRVGAIGVGPEGEVSIYVGEETLWGEGVATEALSEVCEQVTDLNLTARIHPDNEPSIALFERCGFERAGSDDEWLLYER